MDHRTRLRIRLTPETDRQLELMASRPHVTRSDIVEAALKAFFNPAGETERINVLARRLDMMGRLQARLVHSQEIASEALGLFIRMYLAATPPFTGADAAAQQALGARRYEGFLVELRKRLDREETLLARLAATGRVGAKDPAANDEAAAAGEGQSDAA